MKNSNGKIKITYREALKQGLRKALDEKTFLAWVAKTYRVIRREDVWRKGFYDLDAPIQRLRGVEVPIPCAAHMEEVQFRRKKILLIQLKK
jgi:pyruvate/2-oxoglutarate/acetoin dehydrogenase E1 component